MQIKYIGAARGPVEVPQFGLLVEPGVPFEVKAEIGRQLLAQPSNWQKVTQSRKEGKD